MELFTWVAGKDGAGYFVFSKGNPFPFSLNYCDFYSDYDTENEELWLFYIFYSSLVPNYVSGDLVLFTLVFDCVLYERSGF